MGGRDHHPGTGRQPGNQERLQQLGMGRRERGGVHAEQGARGEAGEKGQEGAAGDPTLQRQRIIDQALAEFDGVTIKVPIETKGGKKLEVSVTVESPYRINYTSTDYAVGHKSYPSKRLPRSKEGSPDGLKGAVTNSKLGKGSAAEIRMVLQEAIRQGLVKLDKLDDKFIDASGKLTEEGDAHVQAALAKYMAAGRGRLIGVDCSGFIYHIVMRMMAAGGDKSKEWLHGLLNTGTSNLKSDKRLTTIATAKALTTGDLLLHARHVEMVRDSTQLSAEDAAKLGIKLEKGAVVYKLGVVESSPNGGREGPTGSEWVAVQGKSGVTYYKKSGKTWKLKRVLARRPNVLGSVPRRGPAWRQAQEEVGVAVRGRPATASSPQRTPPQPGTARSSRGCPSRRPSTARRWAGGSRPLPWRPRWRWHRADRRPVPRCPMVRSPARRRWRRACHGR